VGGFTNDFDWRIIRITDNPIRSINESEELPAGEIGELIVKGPQVSKRYLVREPEASAPGVKQRNGRPTATRGAPGADAYGSPRTWGGVTHEALDPLVAP